MIRNVASQKFSFTRAQMPCGKPAILNDLTTEQITLAEMFGVKAENLMVCPAVGDSMVDEGFEEGDLLFVDSSLIPTIGDVVLAEIDGELSVKKIDNYPPLRLVSCNAEQDYKPIEPLFNFHSIGVIVGSFRFRK